MMGLDGNIVEHRLLKGVLAPSVTRKSSEVEIDNKSIIRDAEGKLRTAVGGADLGSDSIAWDGNTEGRVYFSEESLMFYKVSDATPNMSSDMYVTVDSNMLNDDGKPETLTEPALVKDAGAVDSLIFLFTDAIMDGEIPLVIVSLSDNVNFNGMIVPEKGVYFIHISQGEYYITTKKFELLKVQKIDSKFLDLVKVYEAIANVPKVTSTSQLTNDSGFLTINTLPKYRGDWQ